MSPSVHVRRLVAVAMLATLSITFTVAAGSTVNVSTEPQLQAAIQQLTSNTTIVIAPGTYVLTNTLYINGTFSNVTITGSSTDRDAVVLKGPGMANSSYGNTPYGIWTGGN